VIAPLLLLWSDGESGVGQVSDLLPDTAFDIGE
jgi:hypothetical protein